MGEVWKLTGCERGQSRFQMTSKAQHQKGKKWTLPILANWPPWAVRRTLPTEVSAGQCEVLNKAGIKEACQWPLGLNYKVFWALRSESGRRISRA